MQTSLYRVRRQYIPPAPILQSELNINSGYFFIDQKSIVIGDIQHSDGLRTLIFSTDQALEILARAETIHGNKCLNFIFST